MKAILEFELPEENNEYTLANDASKYYGALWDITMWLRGKLKHDPLSELEYSFYESAQKEIHDIIDANGVNLDKVN